jgi:hypothetical protein
VRACAQSGEGLLRAGTRQETELLQAVVKVRKKKSDAESGGENRKSDAEMINFRQCALGLSLICRELSVGIAQVQEVVLVLSNVPAVRRHGCNDHCHSAQDHQGSFHRSISSRRDNANEMPFIAGF